jgi:predicted NACHT family NTPase
LPLAGFKTKLRVPIALEELYVPLQAHVDLRASGDAIFADAREGEERLKSAHGALDIALIDAFREAAKRRRRGLVILGDPGSGKTTHLKRLLLWCLRQGPEEMGLAPESLPVFLPLRDLRDLSKGIDGFIEQTLDNPHLRMPEGFGARLLARGRCYCCSMASTK